MAAVLGIVFEAWAIVTIEIATQSRLIDFNRALVWIATTAVTAEAATIPRVDRYAAYKVQAGCAIAQRNAASLVLVGLVDALSNADLVAGSRHGEGILKVLVRGGPSSAVAAERRVIVDVYYRLSLCSRCEARETQAREQRSSYFGRKHLNDSSVASLDAAARIPLRNRRQRQICI
jgi:hypothetical protein